MSNFCLYRSLTFGIHSLCFAQKAESQNCMCEPGPKPCAFCGWTPHPCSFGPLSHLCIMISICKPRPRVDQKRKDLYAITYWSSHLLPFSKKLVHNSRKNEDLKENVTSENDSQDFNIHYIILMFLHTWYFHQILHITLATSSPNKRISI